jgi:putative hemolysin
MPVIQETDPSLEVPVSPAAGTIFDPATSSPFIRLLQKLLGITELSELYPQAEQIQLPGEFYYSALLRLLNVNWSLSEADLQRIPRCGPCLVVANHPFGMIEGTVLGALIERLRPDVRVVANSLLMPFPKVAEYCFLVNPFGGAEATRANRIGLRQSLRWLAGGGLLVVFPAGEVSSLNLKRGVVHDPPWSPSVGRLARLADAPVLPVFIEGRNSVPFQIAGLIHPRIRTALLPYEFLNKRGKSIVIRTGKLITPKKLATFATDEERTEYLRSKSYVLANRQEPRPQLPVMLVPLKEKLSRHIRTPLDAVVDATDPERMEIEIRALAPDDLLDSQAGHDVYIAQANRVPSIVREIGRLREITFRETGEGTGKSIDIDDFDSYYLHLFVWNRSARQIVGAYRLGASDLILKSFGLNGFYTQTLFSYNRTLLERITPALEMGRSFVRPEYQKTYAPLLLLWRGIGAYVAKNPQYKVLFGPVSISNDYHPNSRQLIVSFLKEYCRAEDLARLVRARSPFRTRPLPGWEPGSENGTAWDIEELSALVADIETDQKGMPILLKQYLKLGGRLLGFNLDPHFSNALDGLIVVDLVKTDPRLLERYMGKEGAASFLGYHNGPVAQAR